MFVKILIRYWLIIACLSFVSCGSLSITNLIDMGTNDDKYTVSRAHLVWGELSPRIKDIRVLKAIESIPRHLFVPQELASQAYLNRALAIGFGQTISQPLIVALMTEALQTTNTDRILEIGTGSGYQAAVLSQLVAEVYTVEILRPLAERTAQHLTRQGYTNIKCLTADGSDGWQAHAPYDGIIVTASPKKLPLNLLNQLKIGGRIVFPVGEHEQRLKVITKSRDEITETDLGPVRFVPMTGKSLS